MLAPGWSRQRLARTLNAGFAEGLLSERTLAHRLDLLLSTGVVDPTRLVGDLTRRVRRRKTVRVVLAELRAGLFHRKEDEDEESLRLLALDWTGSRTELLIGRNSSCDIRIDDLSVSRQHARLVFRDGAWVLQDLQSTNGTLVNGTRVGRCRLRPGDRLVLGQQVLQVD